jgi:glycosyltransferase involved in cell wall biosynthesis
MRVLFDHQTFLLQRHGGISRYFFELITRLVAQPDARIDVFMGIHINDCGMNAYRDRFGRFFGLRRPELPHLLTASLMLDGFLFSLFARKSQPDIYHPTYFYNLVPELKAKRIVTVYDMIYELYPGDYSPDDVTASNKKEAVRRADGVICISESTKNDLLNFIPIPEERVRVIHLANSLTLVVDSPPVIQSPYVLFVGKRGGYKNFDRLLVAYAHSSRVRDDYRLICFGGGPFQPAEIERMKALAIEGRIEFVGGSDRLLANLYTFASLLVYPSLHEGFGMPPLEAMHYGCPVIVSKTSSMPEIVGEAGVYVDPNSEEQFITAMEEVLYKTDVRSAIIRAGHQREDLFSWDRCARETIAFYRRVLNSS